MIAAVPFLTWKETGENCEAKRSKWPDGFSMLVWEIAIKTAQDGLVRINGPEKKGKDHHENVPFRRS